jgi:hypothetical protein
VSEALGPTLLLPRSHTHACHDAYHAEDPTEIEELLATHPLSLGLLRRGDALLMDSRLLHCGGENRQGSGAQRVVFYFSFRTQRAGGLPGTISPEDRGAWQAGWVGGGAKRRPSQPKPPPASGRRLAQRGGHTLGPSRLQSPLDQKTPHPLQTNPLLIHAGGWTATPLTADGAGASAVVPGEVGWRCCWRERGEGGRC